MKLILICDSFSCMAGPSPQLPLSVPNYACWMILHMIDVMIMWRSCQTQKIPVHVLSQTCFISLYWLEQLTSAFTRLTLTAPQAFSFFLSTVLLKKIHCVYLKSNKLAECISNPGNIYKLNFNPSLFACLSLSSFARYSCQLSVSWLTWNQSWNVCLAKNGRPFVKILLHGFSSGQKQYSNSVFDQSSFVTTMVFSLPY